MQETPLLLKLSDFDYEVPAELVAQQPTSVRDESRMLVRQADGSIGHRIFKDLPQCLPAGSVIILNDTSVIQSRLHGFLKTGARIEIFLLEQISGLTWRAMAKPLKKLRVGTEILFSTGGNVAVVRSIETAPDGEVPCIEVEFSHREGKPDFDFFSWLDEIGETPLPPYIHRDLLRRRDPVDKTRYETVFAKVKGSVAAPTAGLHFTPGVLEELKKSGCTLASVTLHVGGGTFLPVRQEDVALHQIHAECFLVPPNTVAAIIAAKNSGAPVFCVGTTSFRAIESLWQLALQKGLPPEDLSGQWHETRLFLHPQTAEERYRPKVTDGIITNFHQPKSTLFMLISALIGLANAKAMYATAIEKKYRLFSYGDSTLLFLNKS